MQSNEYFKDYVSKNNVKITCDICNCQFLKFNKPLHEKTQKHQRNLEMETEKARFLANSEIKKMLLQMKKVITEQKNEINRIINGAEPPTYESVIT